jgi:UDP-glucose-4-epimerase GalE
MRQNGVNKIVFSSSCATYDVPNTVPILEDAPQNPINPYGASKLMIERILGDYGNAYGLASISLRYFNAAGADPEGELGEEHDSETHLIPLVLDAAAGRRPYISVFGDDYDTPDGTCIRDYIHVSDLADAHVLAMKRLEDTALRQAYNLGTGHGNSVAQVIDAARAVTGKDIRVVKGTRRPGDPAELSANPARVKKDLGWITKYPAIADSLKTAWRWSSQNVFSLVSSNTPAD